MNVTRAKAADLRVCALLPYRQAAAVFWILLPRLQIRVRTTDGTCLWGYEGPRVSVMKLELDLAPLY